MSLSAPGIPTHSFRPFYFRDKTITILRLKLHTLNVDDVREEDTSAHILTDAVVIDAGKRLWTKKLDRNHRQNLRNRRQPAPRQESSC